MNTLSIMTCTYDRLLSYIRCIKSIKPILSDRVKLEIFVDNKLPKDKYKIKKYITKLILGNANYSIQYGKNTIGRTRDHAISNCKSTYMMILDDDDELNVSEFNKCILDLDFDLLNFDYHPNNYNNQSFYKVKPNFIPWGLGIRGLNDIKIGTSTIFKVDYYNSLDWRYKFEFKYMDDITPMYAMYILSDNIWRWNSNPIKRCRASKSMTLSMNPGKLVDIFISVRIIFNLIDRVGRYRYLKNLIINNLVWYYSNKSGEEYGYQLKRLLNNLK